MGSPELFLEDFEGGTGAVTAANTAFTAVSSGITFSTAWSAHGSKSALLSTGSTAATQFCQVSLGSAHPLLFGVLYLKPMAAYPSSTWSFWSSNLSGSARGDVRVNTNGTISIRNGFTAVWTSPSPLPKNTALRVERKLDATAGVQQLRVYALHSTTPLFDSGPQTFNTGSVDTVLVGVPAATANISGGIDWVGLSAVDWIGPAVSSAGATANAGPDQAAARPWQPVTLDGSASTPGAYPIVSWNWAPTGGAPALTGTGAVRTFTPAGTLTDATYTYSLTVTDSNGATSSADTVTVTVPATAERVMLGSSWAPALVTLAPFGGLADGGGGGGETGSADGALTLTVTPEPDWIPPRIRVDVTDTRAVPATTLTILHRGIDGHSYPVRTADGGPQPVSGGLATLYDYEPDYEAAVTFVTDQAGGPTAVTSLDVHDVWLVHPGIPSRSCRVKVTTLPPPVQASSTGLHKVLGSGFQVPISSGARDAGASVLGLRTYTAEQERALRLLCEDDAVLLLNIPPSKVWGWDACYVSVGDLTPARTAPYGRFPYREWQLPIQIVGRPGGGTQAALTWNTVADQYPTWQSILDAGITSWAQLAAPTT